MLFPTRHRSKISSKLSYPVGAELISAQLATVPQARTFDISFSSAQNYFLKNRGDPYAIFSVWFAGTKEYEPGWHVRVQPVPRVLKHTVAAALKAEFFPQIRKWLVKYAPLDARHGAHIIRVIFDEKSETMLKLEEHHPCGEALSN